jgi:hypothetical protein
MTRLALILATTTVLAFGCKGDSTDAKIKEFEGFRDQMCKCTEKTCANKVLEDWRSWRSGTKGLKPSDDQKARIKEIDHAFHECEHKAGGGEP